MLTVILSEIAAVKIDAACWMPARKLAGAAIAAASNKRLMVMPPEVIARTVVAPPSAFAVRDVTASLVRAVDGIATGPLLGGVPRSGLAGDENFAKTSGPAVSRELKLSEGSCGSVMCPNFIA